jgi:hypothetical protein
MPPGNAELNPSSRSGPLFDGSAAKKSASVALASLVLEPLPPEPHASAPAAASTTPLVPNVKRVAPAKARRHALAHARAVAHWIEELAFIRCNASIAAEGR